MNQTLGKYRLIAELAQGGMGTVFLAVVRGPACFNKLVVIKQLRPGFAEDANFTAMFLEEARLAARLHHPNVVQTNEVVCDPEHGYFIVMEYLEGASLKRIVRALRARDSASVGPLYARAVLDVLTALEYAHGLADFDGVPLNLVHRDVNPDNVVVTYGGQVKLLDFGIAKAADSAQVTQAGILKGKLRYMAPEQMAGDKVDRRADLFAVGGMLWDALAGRGLWDGMKGIDVMSALVHGVIKSPRSFNPHVSEELERICMRALAFKPEDRYPEAASFRSDLEHAFGVDVMSSTGLARAMAAEFAEERARMRVLVAQQPWTIDEAPTRALPSLASEWPPPSPSTTVADEIVPMPDALAISESPPPLPPEARGRRKRALAWGTLGTAALCGVVAASIFAFRPSLPRAVAAMAPAETAASMSAAIAAPSEQAPPGVVTLAAPSTRSAPMGLPTGSDVVPSRVGPPGAGVASRTGRSPLRSAAPGGAEKIAKASVLSPAAPASLPETAQSPAEAEAAAPPASSAVAEPSLAAPAAAPATSPMMSTVSATAAGGSVAGGAVRAVVSAHSQDIQHCVDVGAADQLYMNACESTGRLPAVCKRVRIGMEATLAPDGHVQQVTTSASRDGAARLQACVRKAVGSWVFPEPGGGEPGHVSYSFVFE